MSGKKSKPKKRQRRKLPAIGSIKTRPASSQWLVKARRALGITQKQLASHIGVNVRTIIEWEVDGLPTHGTGAQLARIKIKELEDKYRKI